MLIIHDLLRSLSAKAANQSLFADTCKLTTMDLSYEKCHTPFMSTAGCADWLSGNTINHHDVMSLELVIIQPSFQTRNSIFVNVRLREAGFGLFLSFAYIQWK